MTKQVLPEAYDAGIDDGAGYCYAYDSVGRLTQIQDPDGNILHTYTYNGDGQTIRETDGEGQETLYAYNGVGQLTRAQTTESAWLSPKDALPDGAPQSPQRTLDLQRL